MYHNKRFMIRRTRLYVPSISEKMIMKSVELDVDSIIFDLEDAGTSRGKGYHTKVAIKSPKRIRLGKEGIIC